MNRHELLEDNSVYKSILLIEIIKIHRINFILLLIKLSP